MRRKTQRELEKEEAFLTNALVKSVSSTDIAEEVGMTAAALSYRKRHNPQFYELLQIGLMVKKGSGVSSLEEFANMVVREGGIVMLNAHELPKSKAIKRRLSRWFFGR